MHYTQVEQARERHRHSIYSGGEWRPVGQSRYRWIRDDGIGRQSQPCGCVVVFRPLPAGGCEAEDIPCIGHYRPDNTVERLEQPPSWLIPAMT